MPIVRSLLALAAAVLPVTATLLTTPAHATPSPPVEVMVIGSHHFSNPGRDLTNAAIADVRADRRQAELERLAEALAGFRPTRVAVEMTSDGPGFELPAYTDFTPARLREERGEHVQIGFRLARRLGHAAVYGFDEQPVDGEPDYFPFEPVARFAAETGRGPWLDGLLGAVQRDAAEFERRQEERSIAAWLIDDNDPARIEAMHREGYAALLTLGDGTRQPGAELNAMWYLRNAKMFGKLTNIARPGDRLVVIVGAGHGYWLRRMAAETPGYTLVDPLPYLRAADAAAPSGAAAVGR